MLDNDPEVYIFIFGLDSPSNFFTLDRTKVTQAVSMLSADPAIMQLLIQYKFYTNYYKFRMSKKNQNKDNKGAQSQSSYELIIDQQKRELLENSFMIKKLQQSISKMTVENHDLTNIKNNGLKDYKQKLEIQKIVIQTHEQSIEKLSSKLREMQLKNIQNLCIIKELTNEKKGLQESREKELEEYKNYITSSMNILQNQLKQYNHYMKERDTLQKEKEGLRKDLQSQKNTRIRELADKEREKVQSIDKIKQEMIDKIGQMRKNLLSLKKEQLETTTRIAVLQNHQLTEQLQFQSKQTEKLIFQNQNLHKKVSQKEQDLKIHKEIEEELAKRSHISKGVIKKLTQRIQELEKELREKSQRQESEERKMQEQEQITKRENMILLLDKSLTENEKKFSQLQTDYQLVENENKTLRTRLTVFERKSIELSTLLTNYYEDLLDGKLQLKSGEQVFDIRGLSGRNVQEWSGQQIKMVINTLLNELKHKFNQVSRRTFLSKTNTLNVSDDELIENKLPRISEHTFIKGNKKGLKEMPVNMGTKIVKNNLREWGRTIHTNSVIGLSKKYRVQK